MYLFVSYFHYVLYHLRRDFGMLIIICEITIFNCHSVNRKTRSKINLLFLLLWVEKLSAIYIFYLTVPCIIFIKKKYIVSY